MKDELVVGEELTAVKIRNADLPKHKTNTTAG
jgi:hypothetical protein